MTSLHQVDSSGTPIKKASDQKHCYSCSVILHESATNCPMCGAVQPTLKSGLAVIQQTTNEIENTENKNIPAMNFVYCRGCGNTIHKSAAVCPKCGAPQSISASFQKRTGGRDRVTAVLLAFLLGGLGGHKFYLGQVFLGFLYLIFCWTFVPAFIALIEAIIYLTMTDEAFSEKYQ